MKLKKKHLSLLLLLLLFRRSKTKIEQTAELVESTISGKYSYLPASLAISPSCFTLKNGEVFTWENVGSAYNYVQGIENDERCLFGLVNSSELSLGMEVTQLLSKYPIALSAMTCLMFPPPGVGTIVGLVAAAFFTWYNNKDPDHTESNMQLFLANKLSLEIPLSIFIDLSRQGMICDADPMIVQFVTNAKNEIEQDFRRIQDFIENHKSVKLDFNNFLNIHKKFNQMLRDIATYRELPTVEEQLTMQVQELLEEGHIFEKISSSIFNTLMDSTTLKDMSYVFVERYHLIKVCGQIGYRKVENASGLYTYLIPQGSKPENYVITLLHEELIPANVQIRSSANLLTKAIPYRKGYMTTTKEKNVTVTELGSITNEVTIRAGLQTVATRISFLNSGTLYHQQKLANNQRITFSNYTSEKSDFVIHGDLMVKSPLVVQSNKELFIDKTELPAEITFFAETADQKFKKFLAAAKFSGIEFFVFSLLINNGVDVDEAYDAIVSGFEIWYRIKTRDGWYMYLDYVEDIMFSFNAKIPTLKLNVGTSGKSIPATMQSSVNVPVIASINGQTVNMQPLLYNNPPSTMFFSYPAYITYSFESSRIRLPTPYSSIMITNEKFSAMSSNVDTNNVASVVNTLEYIIDDAHFYDYRSL